MFLRAFAVAFALLFSANTVRGQAYEIARQFTLGGGTPRTPLLAASDGSVYGTDYYGGDYSTGAIYRFTPDGSGGFTYQHLWSFKGPDGAYGREMIQAADAKLYGIAFLGGFPGAGTAFVFDPSAALVVLHNFEPTDASGTYGASGLVQATDGQFYGLIFAGGAHDLGSLFRLSPSGDFSILHDFQGPEGAQPYGALVQASDGFLYGTTVGGASGPTLFRADLSGAVTSIHSFSSLPTGTLVEGLDGNLYGTTTFGGSGGAGTLYRSDKSGNVTVIFNFPSPDGGAYPNPGLARAADGSFYGTTEFGGPLGGGTVFRITPEGDLTTVASFDGAGPPVAHPVATVTLASDGSLWGTLADGGFDNAGGVFRIPLPDTQVQFLHENGTDVATYPVGVLTQTPDGTLWGRAGGGSLGHGTLFNLSGGPLRPVLVHDFQGTDGDGPQDLWAATDGNLYGTTSHQGPNGEGTVFRIDAASLALTTLHAFGGSDGADPEAGMIQAIDGNFYGTTYAGGALGLGTLFRMDITGGLTTLTGLGPDPQPSHPVGRLLQGSDANLYAASGGGGSTSGGTVFRSNLSGGLTTLHSFDPQSGDFAQAGLVQADDGNYYGVASSNLTQGTVYRIDSSGTFTTIHSFDGNGQPQFPPVQASDGRLYGTTSSSTTVYRMDLAGGNFETVRDFGGIPIGGLFRASDDMLYGTATSGNFSGGGLIFRFDLTNSAPSIASLSPTSGRAAGGVIVTITGDHFHPDVVTIPSNSTPFDAHTIFNGTPAFPPGSLNDFTATNTDGQSVTLPGAFFADFLDAAGDNQFHADIETIFRDGITAGCGGGNYCTDAPASRAQMAVLLLKVEHGPGYAPPPCIGAFPDVVCPSLFADWIEQFAAEEITAGCGGGNYCPADPVTRDQLAVLILKYEHGSAYVPPACAGIFGDVECPSTFADWIEQFAAEKITVGCGNGNYCPDIPTTRGQMAVFLAKALTFP
jgi:uncharacterized repeat protein (TIGR03803 family)